MSRKPSIVETCPVCSTTFIIAPIHERGRTPYKVCPDGHETSIIVLAKNRRPQPAPNPVKPAQEKGVLLRAREIGILGQKASERMALAAMIGCYEKLKETTPALSHGVIDGVFEKTVKVSRAILGVV